MKKALVLLLIVILMFVFVACSRLSTQTFTSFDYFATVITYNSSVENDSEHRIQANSAWEDMTTSLGILEDYLSVYKDDSDIAAFNGVSEGTKIEISKLTYKVLSFAKQAYENTNGLYNPAMYLLSDLWGFTDRFTTNEYTPTKPYDRQNPRVELPQDKYVEGFLSLTDYSQVVLEEEGDKYYATKPNISIEIDGYKYTMQLDLGGMLKGYAAAVLAITSRNYGINYGYVTLGSSSLALLEKDAKGTKWDLKLKDPQQSDSFYVQTPQSSVYISTSGNYEQYYEIDGKRYCHIINPQTGRPIDNTNLSTTIIKRIEVEEGTDYELYESSMLDAYSTALMVMNIDEAKQFASDNGLTVYIAQKEGSKSHVYTNDQNAKILANYEVK